MPGRARYVICGLGNRGVRTYLRPLLDEFASAGEVVGLVDPRVREVAALARDLGCAAPCVAPGRYESLLAETAPDGVIVATPDGSHVDYLLGALDRDLDVIVEKPIVTTCMDAAAVLLAEARSEGTVTVAMNLRHDPVHLAIKRLLLDGAIGRVVNVELVYNLDAFHGPSYFLRWHRYREQSGGLSVTKGCHHFDLINWFVDSAPEQVFAYGGLNYFGVRSPHRPTLTASDPYAALWSSRHHASAEWGSVTEAYDTLTQSLFDEEIEIEDTYSAVVRYENGTTAAYSSNFSAGWEGYQLGINGTLGRIETTHVVARERYPLALPHARTVRLFPLFDEPRTLEFPAGVGGHADADRNLLCDLFFGPGDEALSLNARATAAEGACAVAVGEAVWRSVRENRAIGIRDELLSVRGDLQETTDR